MSEQSKIAAYPLFKGATRVPTFWGAPVVPLGIAFSLNAMAAMLISLWFWLMLPLVVLFLRAITKNDDRIFRAWGLALDTRWRNPNKAFWGGSSYAPVTYDRFEGRT